MSSTGFSGLSNSSFGDFASICQVAGDNRLGTYFNDEQLLWLKVVTVLFASASVLGSAFIIMTFHLTAVLHRSLSLHIVYALSLSDLATSIVYLVGWNSISSWDRGGEEIVTECSAYLCMVSAIGQQLFGLGCILWTTMIALHLHLSLLGGMRLPPTRSTVSLLHLAVWGIAGISVLVLALTHSFGPAGQWCWIREERIWARLTFFYVPLGPSHAAIPTARAHACFFREGVSGVSPSSPVRLSTTPLTCPSLPRATCLPRLHSPGDGVHTLRVSRGEAAAPLPSRRARGGGRAGW